MKVSECMTKNVVSVAEQEPASVAARLMSRGNVGMLPVRGAMGRLSGVVTDRDLTLRCAAAGRDPNKLTVRDVMTSRVVTAAPDMELARAAALMTREQVRRLPVVEDGRVVGIVSLGDLARQEDYSMEAASCLEGICEGIHSLD
jgi:CBS domain-containing protein